MQFFRDLGIAIHVGVGDKLGSLHPDQKIVRASYDLLDGPGGAEQVVVEMTEALRTQMYDRVTALLDLLSRPEDAVMPAYLTQTPNGEMRECSAYCVFYDLCHGAIGRMLGDVVPEETPEAEDA